MHSAVSQLHSQCKPLYRVIKVKLQGSSIWHHHVLKVTCRASSVLCAYQWYAPPGIYLGQILEKGGGFVVGILPKGLVLKLGLSQSTQIVHIFSFVVLKKCLWKLLVNSTDT